MSIERFQGVLVVGREEYELIHKMLGCLRHGKAINAWHIYIQKNDVRVVLVDGFDPCSSAIGFRSHRKPWHSIYNITQLPTCRALIVDNHNSLD